MRKMLFALALMASAPLMAEQSNYNIGSNAAPWLNVPGSVRSAALAEAGTSMSGDLMAALAQNPAGLASFRFQQLAFTEDMWLLDTSLQQVGYGYGTDKYGTVALGFTYMNYGSIDKYELINSGNAIQSSGSFNPYGMAFKLDYGYQVVPWASLGLGVKWVRESIDTLSSDGFGADLGLLLTPMKSLNVGLSGLNLGGTLHDSSLPALIRVGAMYSLPPNGDNGFSILGDAAIPTADSSSMSAGGGLEYAFQSAFFGRLGWRWQGNSVDGNTGLSAGLGFRLTFATLEYAYVAKGDLGNSNQIGLAASF